MVLSMDDIISMTVWNLDDSDALPRSCSNEAHGAEGEVPPVR